MKTITDSEYSKIRSLVKDIAGQDPSPEVDKKQYHLDTLMARVAKTVRIFMDVRNTDLYGGGK